MTSKDHSKNKKGSSKISIDSQAVRQLADLFKDTDLSEIEYEANGCRIRVARHQAMASYSLPPQLFSSPALAPVAAPSAPQAPSPATPASATMKPEEHPGVVRSPMVGTIYLAAKPGDPSFVTIGSNVSEGQTLMIIEAMKVMNPLKAAKSGKVTHILVEDGQPVEYDEPLLIIE